MTLLRIDGCSNKETELHMIPFKIDYEGEAPVQEYFQSRIEIDENMTYHCSLYGRKMRGQKINVEGKTLITVGTREENEEGVLYTNTTPVTIM